ncbi:Hydroxyindole-O-methyltransferase and related SAM-dependent methyltransferases [Ceraceosorus bombacis]|uniref:Alpha N-terminal protein methyltransferase 1 n=1 Tax=Ceraceosorus bombacis TaxID=401625 RepID=A0A0P1BRI8_9BASI|nr:Hydroxyindole-O-methyltransferase and related SAM-dependent methyltransferases [Ceraceosorus bombacis]
MSRSKPTKRTLDIPSRSPSPPTVRPSISGSKSHAAEPDVEGGVEYWRSVAATVDGVLGGYGKGTLPRVDALGSRLFLLGVLPRLDKVKSSKEQLNGAPETSLSRSARTERRTRGLDTGAGVGRVSRDVLSRLLQHVDLVEPAENQHKLREEARFAPDTVSGSSKAQKGGDNDEQVLYDVVWAQWMLQHLSDEDLIKFLQAAKKSLIRPDLTNGAVAKESSKGAILDGSGCIFVKENVCQEKESGEENVWFDEEDKSITRSRKAFERVFESAGLEIIKTEVQLGLPAELFAVRMWALR